PLCYRITLPPLAPPFPYTTLFRSPRGAHGFRRVRVAVARKVDDRRAVGELEQVDELCPSRRLRDLRELLLVGERVDERGLADVRDRKSTRLNSSHQISSYAVFCLK